jgi:hypothetical protein
MNELISKVRCPKGCQNSRLSERTKTVTNPSSNLLQEAGVESPSVKVKVYTCQCCGQSFEMSESNSVPAGKQIL